MSVHGGEGCTICACVLGGEGLPWLRGDVLLCLRITIWGVIDDSQEILH